MVSKQEMSQIMDILKTAYPRYYNNISRDETIKTINLWTEMFSDTDLLTLAIAVKSLISHFEFPPTIADIRKEIVKLNSDKKINIDYWNEAYKMICNGSYMTEEQFEQHSEICKRYFGSLNRLREKARTEDLNLEVEQSLFNKTAESMLQNEKQEKMIPNDIQFKLKEMTKRIGG